MPSPKKRSKLARAQRPASSIYFTNGLLEDIESIQVNPYYILDVEDSDSDIHDPVTARFLLKEDLDNEELHVDRLDIPFEDIKEMMKDETVKEFRRLSVMHTNLNS